MLRSRRYSGFVLRMRCVEVSADRWLVEELHLAEVTLDNWRPRLNQTKTHTCTLRGPRESETTRNAQHKQHDVHLLYVYWETLCIEYNTVYCTIYLTQDFTAKYKNPDTKSSKGKHACTCMYVVAQSFEMVCEILTQKKLIRWIVDVRHKPRRQHLERQPRFTTKAIQNTDVYRFELQRALTPNIYIVLYLTCSFNCERFELILVTTRYAYRTTD